MKRLDDQGERALVQVPRPVNRFPDFVAELLQRLRVTLPAMGKVRLAQLLARAGVVMVDFWTFGAPNSSFSRPIRSLDQYTTTHPDFGRRATILAPYRQ